MTAPGGRIGKSLRAWADELTPPGPPGPTDLPPAVPTSAAAATPATGSTGLAATGPSAATKPVDPSAAISPVGPSPAIGPDGLSDATHPAGPVDDGWRPGAEPWAAGGDGISLRDCAEVTELLDRAPQGGFQVRVRHADGRPRVIRNEPLLADGTPMPTRYWLVSDSDRLAISRLESRGGVRRAEAAVDPAELAAAHARYAAERDAALPADHCGPRPSGGVGGTRRGVKCLHAHFAWYLAGGEDPVGAWVAAELTGEVEAPPSPRSDKDAEVPPSP